MSQATPRKHATRGLGAPRPARQARSQQTRDTLLAAGWTLLKKHSWDEITINDIVAAAGSSVGAFYARFTDRDVYFESLAGEWLARAAVRREAIFARLNERTDVAAIAILDNYRMLMRHEHFWRAALVRGASHPNFWKPFREAALSRVESVIELRSAALGRSLSPEELRHIHFAFQMANGVINNAIVNRPGPLMPGTPEFESELVRGLKAVAGFD